VLGVGRRPPHGRRRAHQVGEEQIGFTVRPDGASSITLHRPTLPLPRSPRAPGAAARGYHPRAARASEGALQATLRRLNLPRERLHALRAFFVTILLSGNVPVHVFVRVRRLQVKPR
jgi:hypothetical protein